MRLDKLLCDSGYGTRKEVKQLIKAGRVYLNGSPCKKNDTKINLANDSVMVDHHAVCYQQYHYYMLHKPMGIVSATQDNVHRTVIDWLGEDYRYIELFPVGRLDIDTTGLLLLTNDGQLAHQLLSPKKHVNKTYYATIDGIVTQEDIEQFAQGLDLGDFVTQPAQLIIRSVDNMSHTSTVEVTICEGKFHQVKRMFQKVGKTVTQLHRHAMGPLQLDDALSIGQWRELTQEEVALLQSLSS